ncbi:hypothetical protein WG907_14870 [Sphingobium sp. AN558]|uniref:hypothetical protein n=1 Tax=Sphingobium sp. AN558 TaxID=3133442 RepID=UPI0030C653CE
MTSNRGRPDEPQADKSDTVVPTGLDQVGDDNASQLPGEDASIKLPIEEGDFNAQPQ